MNEECLGILPISPNIFGLLPKVAAPDEPFCFISEEVASRFSLCQEPGSVENSQAGYMDVAVPRKDMPQGRFGATKLLLAEFPEKCADTAEIIVLVSMYEMDMDHFP